MTRKPLPKAITQTVDHLRETPAGVSTKKRRSRPTERSELDVLPDAEAPALQDATLHDTPDARPEPAVASPAQEDRSPSPSIEDEQQAARRRAEARKIVDRHKMYAAMGGLFPVPLVSVAGVTAINVRMVKVLSDLYQIPFERDRTRSMVVGLMGGAVPAGLAAATTSTLTFVVPGSAFLGLAVSSITAAAVTRGIGLVFIEHFEDDIKSSAADKSEQ